jgi:hypothetical protein
MVLAGYLVEFAFGMLGIIPTNREVAAITEGPQWNYTTVLNGVAVVVAVLLVVRFLRTGGPAMLRMMNAPSAEMEHHGHGGPATHGSHQEQMDTMATSTGHEQSGDPVDHRAHGDMGHESGTAAGQTHLHPE